VKCTGAITGILSRVSSSVGIDIATLAKSILLAGKNGSATLAHTTKAGKEGEQFTLIGNSGALALANQFQ